MAVADMKEKLVIWWEDLALGLGGSNVSKMLAALLVVYIVICLVLGWLWSRQPAMFDVWENAAQKSPTIGSTPVPGVMTTATAIGVAETLLNKAGGFTYNDVSPPTIFMDNMPNWEYGALVQLRDMVRGIRDNFSRSQSQSTEDPFLKVAEPRFNYPANSWIMRSSESMYTEGIVQLTGYMDALVQPQQTNAQFYARADNLRLWLEVVSTRLGSYSQRLSASVGQARLNTDLAGDAAARQSTAAPTELIVKTPWLEIDDNFYEARGACWALVHFLKAIEYDFAEVLEKKNARVSLQQIIRELEQTQDTVYSPVILNGTGFGYVANHSLVMASYISRANAALIDLQELLARG